jgi:hypothetical protein
MALAHLLETFSSHRPVIVTHALKSRLQLMPKQSLIHPQALWRRCMAFIRTHLLPPPSLTLSRTLEMFFRAKDVLHDLSLHHVLTSYSRHRLGSARMFSISNPRYVASSGLSNVDTWGLHKLTYTPSTSPIKDTDKGQPPHSSPLEALACCPIDDTASPRRIQSPTFMHHTARLHCTDKYQHSQGSKQLKDTTPFHNLHDASFFDAVIQVASS